ncbi:MAG: hypothetical protein KDD51_15265 [Bdellovibrionales bacterium]|nr:hypothetical protein [Bdellovibrionales bacterium]
MYAQVLAQTVVEVPKNGSDSTGTPSGRVASKDSEGPSQTDPVEGNPNQGGPVSGNGPATHGDSSTSGPPVGDPSAHQPGAGSPHVSAPVKDPKLPGNRPPVQTPPGQTPPVQTPPRQTPPDQFVPPGDQNPYPYDRNQNRNNNNNNKKNDKEKDNAKKNKKPGAKKAGSKTPPQPPQIPPFQLPPPPPPTEIPEFAEVPLPPVVPFPPYLPLLELLRRDTDQVLGIFGTFFAAMQQSTPQLTSSENFLGQMGAIARQGQTFREQALASFNASLGVAVRSVPRETSSTFSSGSGAPPYNPVTNFQVPPAFPEGVPRTTPNLGIGVPHRSSERRPSPQTH